MRRSTVLLTMMALLAAVLTAGAVQADEPAPATVQHKIYLPAIDRTIVITAAQQGPSTTEQAVVDLVNEARTQAGCAPLKVSAQLTQAARGHSEDMGQRNFFAHDAPAPSATSPWDRIKATGYRYTSAAENIAAGQTTASSVMNAWLNSSGHRANILNCALTEIGVGAAVVSGSTYMYYWTQDFGTPQ